MAARRVSGGSDSLGARLGAALLILLAAGCSSSSASRGLLPLQTAPHVAGIMARLSAQRYDTARLVTTRQP